MKSLYVANLLPETMLALIAMDTSLFDILSLNSEAANRLLDLGLSSILWPRLQQYKIEERERIGLDSLKMKSELKDFLYPDRLRFWVDTRFHNNEGILGEYDQVFIESNLFDSLSWSIAATLKKKGSKVIVVKSEDLFNREFVKTVNAFRVSKVIVSQERDTKISKLLKMPVSKLDFWSEKRTKPRTEGKFINVRNQLGIDEKAFVTGIVWTPRDDWKLITLIKEHTINNYIIFYRLNDLDKFVKSVPKRIRDNALYCFDGLSLVNACNTILFPRVMPECEDVPQNIDISFYDFNNVAYTNELSEVI